jgi:hypothetical protein
VERGSTGRSVEEEDGGGIESVDIIEICCRGAGGTGGANARGGKEEISLEGKAAGRKEGLSGRRKGGEEMQAGQ